MEFIAGSAVFTAATARFNAQSQLEIMEIRHFRESRNPEDKQRIRALDPRIREDDACFDLKADSSSAPSALIQPLHLGHVGLQLLDALRARRVG